MYDHNVGTLLMWYGIRIPRMILCMPMLCNVVEAVKIPESILKIEKNCQPTWLCMTK